MARGLSRYLDVLTSEDTLVTQRRTVADLQARAFAQDVALVRALGGGFQYDTIPTCAQAAENRSVTDQAATAGVDSRASQGTRMRKRSMIFMIIFGVALLVAIAVGAWYLLVGRLYVSTDDAYVHGNHGADHAARRRHHRQRPGRMTPMHVQEGRCAGRSSIPSDAQSGGGAGARPICAWPQQRVDAISRQCRQRGGDGRRAEQGRSSIRAPDRLQAPLRTGCHRRGFRRRNDQCPAMRYDTAQAGLHQAAAAAGRRRRRWSPVANVAHNPDVMAARVALDRAKLDLDRTVIRAPMDGIVAQNTVPLASVFRTGAALMTSGASRSGLCQRQLQGKPA